MEWLNSTPDLTWLQLILISFIEIFVEVYFVHILIVMKQRKTKERKR